MADLQDGESLEVQGSAAKPYVLKNTGGVFSCSCPAWRNQSIPIEQRTCKHLRRLRGEEAEAARIAAAGGETDGTPTHKPRPKAKTGAGDGADEDDAAGAPVLLAERWDGVQDPSGWWLSEKLDGVRAYWDGQAFLSRLGNLYHAPDWFVAGLPATPLDGELWVGRKQFQRAVSIVRRQDRSDLWKEVRFVVFDAPALEAPFEERLAHCRDVLAASQPPYARVHAHERCEGLEALRAELARVEALGGEGLMLRQPGSRYVAGRSATLLKVKSFLDAEARVVAHLPGEGRHKGRLGALLVERPDGTRFSVGTGFSDAERAAPPPLGSVITYRYQELSTGGVPRFPSYLGVRDDVHLPEPGASALTLGLAAASVAAPTPSIESPAPAPPAPVSASPTSAAPASASLARRRFELVDDTSRKFWEIGVEGASLTVAFGRIGSAGQSKTKTFPNAGAAAAEAVKLQDEKTAKGYREVQ